MKYAFYSWGTGSVTVMSGGSSPSVIAREAGKVLFSGPLPGSSGSWDGEGIPEWARIAMLNTAQLMRSPVGFSGAMRSLQDDPE